MLLLLPMAGGGAGAVDDVYDIQCVTARIFCIGFRTRETDG